MVKNAGIITLALIIAVLLMLLNKGCNDAKMVTYNYNAALGELNKYKNSSGQEISTIVALQADYHELQQMNSNLNSTIADLKKQVNKKSETVIIHEVHTRDTIFIETTVIDSSKCHLQAHYNDEWADMDIDINQESAKVNYSVINKYIHKQEWKRRGLFSSPVLEGSVINLNPHTSTQEYISYKKKAPKRTGVKVAIFIAGLVGGVMIAR